jgi:chromosome segregation ATPase
MSNRLKEISRQIDILKTQLNELWDEKGVSNPEILRISEEIDSLLNEYDRLLQNDEIVC